MRENSTEETTVMEETVSNKSAWQTYLVNVAIFLNGGLAALVFFTHDLRLFLVLFPLIFFTYKYKAKTKEEQERREDLSNKSFVFFLLIPASLILIVFIIILFWKLVPAIIQNYSG